MSESYKEDKGLKYRRERLDRGIKARSDGIFALSSYREALYLVFPRALVIVGLLILPLVLDEYWTKVLVITCVMAMLSLSWDFIALTGMLSLGQALFFGIGSYLAGIMNNYLGLSPVFAIPLATIVGSAICTAMISPVLRLRGIYFAMVTFVLPLIVVSIIEMSGVLGGVEGLSALSPLPNLWVTVYFIIFTLLACFFGFRRLMDTDYGLVLKAIRDNDQAVMTSGINIYWYKAQALFIGGAAGTFAGAFMTHHYRFVGLPAFSMDYTIFPIACTVVGGSGMFSGALFGAFLLTPLTEFLRAIGSWRVVFYSFLMVVFIVVVPEGVFHYLQRKYHQFERWVKTE